jgi:hypothetical protein
MPVELTIHDGEPWYLSPDVWTIPGNDPDAPPGKPIAGRRARLKALVRNDGNEDVEDALVRFYWANPSLGVTRETANPLGTARVTLEAHGQAEVLCPTSWSVQYLNEGHLCVLAEAFHPQLDQLPEDTNFSVPTDRHVAQRNLIVAEARIEEATLLGFEVHNPFPSEQEFTVTAEAKDPSILYQLSKTSGIDPELLQQGGRVELIGFTGTGCPTPGELEEAKHELERVELGGHEITGFNLAARLEGSVGLVSISQTLDGKQVGGMSLLLVQGQQDR